MGLSYIPEERKIREARRQAVKDYEIRALSDRIVVMYEGQIVGEVENADVDIEHLGLLMTGGSAPVAMAGQGA